MTLNSTKQAGVLWSLVVSVSLFTAESLSAQNASVPPIVDGPGLQFQASTESFEEIPTGNDCFRRKLAPQTLFNWSGANPVFDNSGEEDVIVTDRPDFTEASSTVGLGVAQLEFGYTYSYNADAGESVRSQSFGEPLLRYGVGAEWLEFRIALFPTEQQTAASGTKNSTSGTADLYLGFKIALTPQDGYLPEMAIIPQMSVPTGSNAFTSNHVEPGLNWIYSWEINSFLATGGQTQGNRRIDDTGDSYLEIAQSWTVAYALTDELGAYTEWFAFFPSNAITAKVQHYFNGGFAYLINNDMQFDVRAGVGLNAAADDFFLGTGFSVRFR